MRKIVIALSGPPGSGASTVGKLLARRLRLRYFSPGKYFKKMSRGKNETEAALRKLKTKVGVSRGFHEHIDKLQIEKAKRGNIVLEGTLSIHFLKDLADFKIWLDANIDKRAARTAKRDRLSVEESKSKLLEREGIERNMWGKIYGFDYYFDQKNDADLVIDSSDLNVNEIVNRIVSFVKRRQAFNS